MKASQQQLCAEKNLCTKLELEFHFRRRWDRMISARFSTCEKAREQQQDSFIQSSEYGRYGEVYPGHELGFVAQYAHAPHPRYQFGQAWKPYVRHNRPLIRYQSDFCDSDVFGTVWCIDWDSPPLWDKRTWFSSY
jgi:hypothetical protein